MSKLMLWDNEYGILEKEGKPVVSSRYVAGIFGKEHFHILRNIANITDTKSGLSEIFTSSNFELSKYKDTTGRTLPEYLLTRDGFTLLVMGFNGKKAMKFKEAYINRFNQMEAFLTERNRARLEFPELTEAILQMHEHPKHYHFSNEMDMINRIVLGMTAKEYRRAHHLGQVDSIRPYLTSQEIKYIAILQKADIGLVLTIRDYQERKRALEWYYLRLTQKELIA